MTGIAIPDEDLLDDADDDRAGVSLPAAPEHEVGRLRQRVAQLEHELRRHQQAAALLEAQLEKAKDTLSFRLGYLLIHGPKSWESLRRLPRDLLDLQREARRRRRLKNGGAAGGPSEVWRLPDHFGEEAFRVLVADGLSSAEAFVEREARSDRERAYAAARLAKALKSTDAVTAVRLAERAYEHEPVASRAKSLAFAQFAAGELERPATLLSALEGDLSLKPGEQSRVAEILGLARLRTQLPKIPARSQRPYAVRPGSSIYVTASALPFTVSGYTVRSHALIRAIASAGVQVTAALRPGYPADRGVWLEQPRHLHDDVEYHHSPGPNARRMSPGEYAESAAQALVELGHRVQPGVVHAASNHVNALPALIAARRLGVPFVYEVRGMWELTAATRQQAWERTERFTLERDLETLIAREADHVLTLTRGMADELADRGIARERISLLPNSVEPERFVPREKDRDWLGRLGLTQRTFVLAYAGSLLAYEGLDDVLRALAILVADNVDAALIVAGDGEAREPLRQLTIELGLEGRVHFLGRLDPIEVPRLWSLADVAAFARKPFRVCELVSPLKPLEPMTMGIPVVVSDVAALREMVCDGETGLVHRAADAADLAAKLRMLSLDAALRRRLGEAARAHVLRERTWQVAGARVVELYQSLT